MRKISKLAMSEELILNIEDQEDSNDYEVKRLSFNSYKIERSVRDILDWIEREKIEIPNFQRQFVWDFNQSSRFIESILLGLPTPDLFMYKRISENGEKFILVDGLQRIKSIEQFRKGEFFDNSKNKKITRNFIIPLRNSIWYKKDYQTLSENDKNYFNDYSLKISVFDSVTKNDDLVEKNLMTTIFERINTGSTSLSTQEIRHAVFNGYATDRLSDYAKNIDFIKLIKLDKSKDISRRLSEEFYLRLLTYLFIYQRENQDTEHIEQGKKIKLSNSKKVMLNNFLHYVNNSHDKTIIDGLAKTLNKALSSIAEVYDESFYAYSFKKKGIYNKVYEVFAEALVIFVCTYEQSLTRNHIQKMKVTIWNRYAESDKSYFKEFFENTTSIENVLKRVNTLLELSKL